jgi:hypothetical protein
MRDASDPVSKRRNQGRVSGAGSISPKIRVFRIATPTAAIAKVTIDLILFPKINAIMATNGSSSRAVVAPSKYAMSMWLISFAVLIIDSRWK